MKNKPKLTQREAARRRLERLVFGTPAQREAVRRALSKEVHHRKVRKRTILGFWLAFTAICAFIGLCWVVS